MSTILATCEVHHLNITNCYIRNQEDAGYIIVATSDGDPANTIINVRDTYHYTLNKQGISYELQAWTGNSGSVNIHLRDNYYYSAGVTTYGYIRSYCK